MKLILIVTLLIIPSLPIFAEQTNVLSIVADNSIIDVNGERDYNMGAVSSIRMKAFQHHVALKFDATVLKGRRPTSARLIYYEGNGDDLDHITISTIQGDWSEGASRGFATSEGGSCFNYAEYAVDEAHRIPWAWPGSTFPDVVYGNSHSLVDYCYTTNGNDGNSYYEWTFDPDLIAANAIGTAYGLSLFESSRIVSMNRTVYSKESSRTPYLQVTSVAGDVTPEAIINLSANAKGLDRAALKLSWTVPTGAFAYNIRISGGDLSDVELPRYMIPFAGTAGSKEDVLIQDVLSPGETYTFSVEAISRSGLSSGIFTITATSSDALDLPGNNISFPDPTQNQGDGYETAALRVWAVPETEKLLPNGSFLASDAIAEAYKTANPVFDGETIKLSAARNEVVAFILGLEATGAAVRNLQVTISGISNISSELFRIGYMATSHGYMPEIIYPTSNVLATDMDENAATEQQLQQMLIELHIDPATPSGNYTLQIKVTDGQEIDLTLPISLNVWSFSLPDTPVFKLEMNDYGYPNYQATFNLLQQRARRDRAHINLVPYGNSRTRMDMYQPDGRPMNESAYNAISPGDVTTFWDDFVAGFDPAFTGTLFNEGPWQNAALDGFYLTFHESWPLDYSAYIDTDEMDAEKAFSNASIYKQTYTNLLADFVELAENRHWTNAAFQVYLNNKQHPWDFDEPYDFWDFKALAFYADLFDQGTVDNSQINVRYRIDISRPQYHRNLLDGKVDLAVVGRDFFTFHRLVNQQAQRDGTEVWNYGTAHDVYKSNHNAQGWPMLAYAFGANGILPWSTIKYTSRADYLAGVTSGDDQKRALYIIDSDSQSPRVYSTLRMKAYRRAAQDIEYLHQAQTVSNLAAGQIQRMILNAIGDRASIDVSSDYVEDAGTLEFSGLSEVEFFTLRHRAAKIIENDSAPVIRTLRTNGDTLQMNLDNLYTNAACIIESTPALTSPSWVVETNFHPVTHSQTWAIPIASQITNSFFRLQKQ